ncbi:dihydrofolate reductase, partial [Escherichia coli]|nr:dihydrofolate reductase [Escherichia coli]
KRPLPGRLNIVITRDTTFRPQEEALVAHSLAQAIELATAGNKDGGAPDGEIAVIGGGQIYQQAMPVADRLYVTHVLADIAGDTHFPDIDPAVWRVVESTDYPAGEKDSHATRYVVYERIRD